MKVRIKRFDSQLPLPQYKSQGAAAIDMYARVETTVPAKGVAYIPLNVALELPKNCVSMLFARSSTHKVGLMLVNSVGLLDSDYKGDNDEYIAAMYNFTDKDVLVEKGFRIAQLLIMQYEQVEFQEVDTLEAPDRGGFGSTGND